MKIIHTSDWHLGARLQEEDRADEQRAFLDWLAKIMAEEKPDALVVSGDIFDVKAPSPQAQGIYYGFLARVVRERLCRKVVVTAGNHDNSKLLAAPSELLEKLGVAVVSVAATDDLRKDVIVVEDGDGRPGLAVAAIPFMFDAELSNFGRGKVPEDAPRDERVRAGWDKHVRDVIAAAKAAVPGVPVVATGHCVLLDARISDAESERCRRVGGIEAYDPAPYAGADYVALGHLHVPQAAKGFPTRIFYSGSPLRMSFDEGDCPKSVNIVTFAAPGEEPTVKTREVPETVPLVTLRGAPEDVKQKLSELVASDRTKRRFVRLQLEGFEGDAQVHWTATRAIAKDTATLVLEECDIRPMSRETVGLRAFAGRDIHHIEPRAVAEQKLKSSNRHFGEEQIAGLMGKFDEAAEEAMA